MPKAFPKEFREDVIRVYKSSDASMAQVAKDFGISPSCLKRWLAIDERNSSRSSGGSSPTTESDALREAPTATGARPRSRQGRAAPPHQNARHQRVRGWEPSHPNALTSARGRTQRGYERTGSARPVG